MTESDFTPQLTADGSKTFFSEEFNELFHSHFGAKQESYFKYVVPTLLIEKAQLPLLRIFDVCYGLGYNTATAIQKIWQVNPNCYIEVIGLELNPKVPQAAITHNLFDSWNTDLINILTNIAFEHHIQTEQLKATLVIGDAREKINQVYQSGFKADAIFLDPFSPPQCPHLWTIEFIKLVSLCLQQDGLLATYSCAAAVRTAFLNAGLSIGSTPPIGRKTPGTIAGFSLNSSPHLLCLCQQEKEHLQTRAAIPYRDPTLIDSPSIIIKRRESEQQNSNLEPTSHWRKRWQIVY
ncbi:tRNA (5-methylaminomethyl-2-thiouridine)(34)-methyltransferase MnmD [Plectonema cf. radiosum LEGE 06105]|uniref:tRNA (5-methylaminomethyl-2-thiouridine)(34)-methyltransferase MnmD n=1 Tax=Plectonema cf. radiosum LEGE 06105 TaxID=945769 RepID=A0A8J7K4J8_9CYAN|nr:MnmC family methyltransferase [Plectonema radiosum]MBE9214737.1 tRNA (5-methylaminomethyl-2-thiouridine)(34)-methyltransferase MnmD [Plectonema cf. radiosum LEGE 06105]